MKTSVVVTRQFNGLPIRQQTKGKHVNLNDLLAIYEQENPHNDKRVEHYFRLSSTKELIDQLEELQNNHKNGELDLGLNVDQKLILTKRGKNGGTWAHPLIFIDFAMWLNTRFKIWALGVVHDKLIEFRDIAGDTYKEMSDALKEVGMSAPSDFIREANMLNYMVLGTVKRGARNGATEEQLELMNKLQIYNAEMIKTGIGYHERKKRCEQAMKFLIMVNKG